ncbi:MAG: DNA topoisomerase IV subunit A [Phycisphaeraceae bacterium]|nr:DNA topoisomerase IV subunit A [Phycisphaeraceae bacterium]
MARRRSSSSDDSSLFPDGEDGFSVVDDGRPTSIPLHEAAQTRYLNYALSVITSRALPDVRDGLKPVQRRILYTMWQQSVTADAKHRKCANVVGEVMGKYHPHGDSSIYEALVRLSQPFAMRMTLVDGSGNFGSLDGDPAAAMRYTECRLTKISEELLAELEQDTVPVRPTYDGTRNEPVVLPARIPNLLVNGATGIAVGMATNIPPHNLKEVCCALLKLLEDPELKTYQLIANDAIQGPDFPTGGQVLNTRDELREIYKNGAGAIRVRARWEEGPVTRTTKTIHITEIPYGVNKSQLVERIAEVVLSRKLPPLLDIKDISAADVRIALELKREADERMVFAYLLKHTPLQVNFNVNLTCLIPTENPEVGRPERCDLREILQNFLQFRLEVVTRRLEHELAQLLKRIHILEGFALVFDALDEIIRIIRASEGKADAAAKIMARFKQLDAEQTDAILELKLYRLAKLEIKLIQDELKIKRARAKDIRKLLDEEDAAGRWSMVKKELELIRDTYGKADPRRTKIEAIGDEPEYSEEDFIIAEDNYILVTRDGWIRRQKNPLDPTKTRLREGDGVLAVAAGSTRATFVFLSSFGVAYTCRIIDIPATTGHGEPVQKLFKLKDGERIIAGYSLDPRVIGDIGKSTRSNGNEEEAEEADNDTDTEEAGEAGVVIPPVHALAVTSDGFSFRFSLAEYREPSTRAGRKFARPRKTATVVGVEIVNGSETVIAASVQRRVILCPIGEINFLSGPGKGVILMKIADDDLIVGFMAASGARDTLTVVTTNGAEHRINTANHEVTSRGGKGREIIKRGTLVRVLPPEPDVPAMLEGEEN